MKPYRKQLEILGKRLLAVLFVYFLCRLAFLFANFSSFSEASLSEILLSFLAGIRFDLSAIAFTNALVVLLHIIPARAFFRPGYQKAVNIIFLVCNAPAILLNCIDLEYFKYQGKRTTADLFGLFTMGSDMQNTLPAMVRDFWYVLLVFAGLFFVLFRINRSIKVQRPGRPQYQKTDWLKAFAVMALVVVAARGGFQYKPLGILSAAQHVPQRLVPLTLNTGFTMIRTIGKSTLEEREWFSPREAAALFNTEKNFSHPEGFKPMNVVIIIMESFSAEYIGFLNGKGYTPVLDSLMKESLVFPNTFANAKKSIDGIPAIIAAIPTLMPFSYITSPYNGNTATSIASLLKQKNYVSGFFHGGNNGTMGFDNFAHMTGFDAYYGRNEYPGDGYDGHWGVFDEPYFSYFADQCAAAKQPFAHVIFSLSSHHPYSIPDHLKGRFPKGELPIHESIGYADYALGKFLEKARKQPWFQNTLFVLTADHTGPNHDPAYNSSTGMFRVPLLFFTGTGSLKGTDKRVAQQTDIIPSILDYLNYDQTFVNFGKSLFDSTAISRAINFTGNVYQAFSDSLVLQFDGEETVGLYNYIHDPLLEKDLSGQKTKSSDKLESYAKAVIQQFNGAMIRNEMTHSAKK